MKFSPTVVYTMVLLASGCVSALDDIDEETGEATGEAGGPIFPDDEQPTYSCALGIPLTCPSMVNFHFSARNSYVVDSRTNRAISSTAVAAISDDGSTIRCQPSSATEVTGIPHLGVTLPAGVFAQANAANTGVYFRDSGGRSVRVKRAQFSPQPSSGQDACALLCDMESPDSTACPNFPASTIDNATITIDGRSSAIDMNGTVASIVPNPLTGITATTCKLSLPANRVAVQVHQRPTDVIAVKRGRFVRGFELSGQELRDACAAISTKICAGVSRCITSETNRCVAEFEGPDSCDFPQPR
jgi:hypothetical protein